MDAQEAEDGMVSIGLSFSFLTWHFSTANSAQAPWRRDAETADAVIGLLRHLRYSCISCLLRDGQDRIKTQLRHDCDLVTEATCYACFDGDHVQAACTVSRQVDMATGSVCRVCILPYTLGQRTLHNSTNWGKPSCPYEDYRKLLVMSFKFHRQLVENVWGQPFRDVAAYNEFLKIKPSSPLAESFSIKIFLAICEYLAV